MASVPSQNAIVPGGVTGYWLIKNKVNGHSALVAASSKSPGTVPQLPLSLIKQFGTSTGNDLQGYYLGGDPKNLFSELSRAMGALQISSDTIPTVFKDLTTKGYQRINFDILVPTGVNANKYQQATSAAGSTLQQAVTNPFGSGLAQTLLRVLEGVVGIALIFLGLQAVIGGGEPTKIATKAAKRMI